MEGLVGQLLRVGELVRDLGEAVLQASAADTNNYREAGARVRAYRTGEEQTYRDMTGKIHVVRGLKDPGVLVGEYRVEEGGGSGANLLEAGD